MSDENKEYDIFIAIMAEILYEVLTKQKRQEEK